MSQVRADQLQTWLPMTSRGPAYTSLEPTSESTALEMSELGDRQGKNAPANESIREADSLIDSSSRPSELPKRTGHHGLSHYYHRFKQLKGYHFSMMCCAVTASVVFVINLVFTVWAVKTSGPFNGTITLQAGSCETTKKLTVGLHLLINILSTLLLGASNYSMQCLSAPTRDEVDRAHSRGIWLDIGVPSIRNMRNISMRNIVLWWLLALSSAPLHLLYNSAVFSTLSVSRYQVYIVSTDFVNGAPFDLSLGNSRQYYGQGELQGDLVPRFQSLLLYYQQHLSEFTRLENEACIEAYSPSIQSEYSDVILVSSTSNPNKSNSFIDGAFGVESTVLFPRANVTNTWICFLEFQDQYSSEFSDTCDISQVKENAQDWQIPCGAPEMDPAIPSESTEITASINYCLTVPAQEQCRLQLSRDIIIIVIVCNLVKAICMGLIAWDTNSRPLVTVGDAIASFLSRPDPSTEGSCMVGKDGFGRNQQWARRPAQWAHEVTRWYKVVSTRRWIASILLLALTFFAACLLLGLGLYSFREYTDLDTYNKKLWSLGFGSVNGATLIDVAPSNLLGAVLLANLPQLVLTFIYFTFNGLFTCMLLAQEWNDYTRTPKPLRVTSPEGQQRSTYRLQLPYRYGIPLLIGSALLHWLVSQSIFLARVETANSIMNGEDIEDSISKCGYSPVALIFVVIFGGIIIIAGIANGYRTYKTKLPVAGSCSAAISAACHPPQADVDAPLRPVMWGVVSKGDDSSEDRHGHCSFTSMHVGTPIPGHWYAGVLPRREMKTMFI